MNKSEVKTYENLKPMRFGESAIWFGSWAIIFIISIYVLLPFLRAIGITEFDCFFIAFTLPSVLMFVTAFVIYYIQNGHSMKGFLVRYRIYRLRLMDVVWGVGVFVVALIVFGLISMLMEQLINQQIVPVPKNLPLLLDPQAAVDVSSLDRFVGGHIFGNWTVFIKFIIMLFFNIAGEELLWRGYILPRQEKALEKNTWLVHGALWALFHSFKWWDILSLLPVTLLIAFAAQKRKSIWPGFIAHILFNIMGLVAVFAAVADF